MTLDVPRTLDALSDVVIVIVIVVMLASHKGFIENRQPVASTGR
jgi:hypothetical protein